MEIYLWQWVSIVCNAVVVAGFVCMAFAVKRIRVDMEEKDHWMLKSVEEMDSRVWKNARNLSDLMAELGFQIEHVPGHTKIVKTKK